MFGKGNPPGGGRRENLTLDVDEFNMRYSLTDGAGWESIGRKLKRFAYTLPNTEHFTGNAASPLSIKDGPSGISQLEGARSRDCSVFG